LSEPECQRDPRIELSRQIHRVGEQPRRNLDDLSQLLAGLTLDYVYKLDGKTLTI
jgi:hypothetical protein